MIGLYNDGWKQMILAIRLQQPWKEVIPFIVDIQTQLVVKENNLDIMCEIISARMEIDGSNYTLASG